MLKKLPQAAAVRKPPVQAKLMADADQAIDDRELQEKEIKMAGPLVELWMVEPVLKGIKKCEWRKR